MTRKVIVLIANMNVIVRALRLKIPQLKKILLNRKFLGTQTVYCPVGDISSGRADQNDWHNCRTMADISLFLCSQKWM